MAAEELIFGLRPARERTDVSVWHVWWTKCKRYRVVRSESTCSEGDSFFAASFGLMEPIGTDYRSLRQAIEAVAAWHGRRMDVEVETNCDAVVDAALRAGLAKPPSRVDNKILVTEGSKRMDIERKDALSLLHALDFKACDGWDNDVIAQNLSVMSPSMPEDALRAMVEGKGDEARTLDAVLGAIRRKDEIRVNGKTASKPANRKAVKKGKAKAPRVHKPEANGKAVKKGSIVGAILEAVRNGPISKDDIHKKLCRKFPSHKPDTLRNTVSWNIATGFPRRGIMVRKDGDGLLYVK